MDGLDWDRHQDGSLQSAGALVILAQASVDEAPLAASLAHSIGRIAPILAPATATARMAAFAPRFPDSVAAYVECRTTPGDDRTDLLLCLTNTAPLAVDSSCDPHRLALANELQRARRTHGAPLHGTVPLLWLEFDDAANWDGFPAPSVCVCLEPDYLRHSRMQAPNPACQSIAEAAVDLAGIDAATRCTVLHCLRVLPVQGRAIHLSFMQGRAEAATKLYVRLSLKTVAPWLEAVGWSGASAKELGELLAWRGGQDPFAFVDLSVVAGRVLDRIALAFPRSNDGLPFREEVFRGLCERSLSKDVAAEVREAARLWTAPEDVALETEHGPPQVVHRWIDQKVALDGANLEFKLYLAIRPVPALLGALAAAGGN